MTAINRRCSSDVQGFEPGDVPLARVGFLCQLFQLCDGEATDRETWGLKDRFPAPHRSARRVDPVELGRELVTVVPLGTTVRRPFHHRSRARAPLRSHHSPADLLCVGLVDQHTYPLIRQIVHSPPPRSTRRRGRPGRRRGQGLTVNRARHAATTRIKLEQREIVAERSSQPVVDRERGRARSRRHAVNKTEKDNERQRAKKSEVRRRTQLGASKCALMVAPGDNLRLQPYLLSTTRVVRAN